LRLAATPDDVMIGGPQSLFGCAEPKNHCLPGRRRRILRNETERFLVLGTALKANAWCHWSRESLATEQ
jgi:hypothetical protein